jgi:hypothetical protein
MSTELHTYQRTGKSENTIFDDEEKKPNNPDQPAQASDEDEDSDFYAEELEEATNELHQFLDKHKFWLRIATMNILYLISLEKCEDSYKHCYKKMHNHFFYWGVYLFFSALMFVNINFTAIYGTLLSLKNSNWDRLNKEVAKFMVIWLNYFLLCSLQQGFSWKNHGTLSRIFFTMFGLKIIGIKVYFFLLRKVEEKKKAVAVGVMLVTVAAIVFSVFWRVVMTKGSYEKGFAGKSIDNSLKGICTFREIGVNWYSAFDEVFWKFSHQDSNCAKQDINLSWIKEHNKDIDLKKEVKYLAYPKSELMDNNVRQHYQLFQEEFMKNLKVVDDLEEASKDHHSFLDFSENPKRPKIVVKIKRDEELIQKMEAIRNLKPDMKRPNILVLMIDSISRQHFFRKMPKTSKYFTKNFFTEKAKNLTGYQYFRFHGLRQHHMANLLALRYDDREYWLASHPYERFENNYKDEGYITATASAKCEVDELDLNKTTKSKLYADRRALDYEFFAAACDPNALPRNSEYSPFKGPFSEFRRCVYGQDSAKHQLDFTKEFWKVYADQPKVQMVTLMDGHEFTGELPVYLDDLLPQFFEDMVKDGLLEDSIVLVLSDHGNNANLFFKGTASGKNELANPFMSVFMSQNNVARFGKHAENNQQKLISHHDVNRVLNEIVSVYKEYTGHNFFSEDIPNNRSCGDAMIPPEFCRCVLHTKKSINRLKRKQNYGAN